MHKFVRIFIYIWM